MLRTPARTLTVIILPTLVLLGVARAATSQGLEVRFYPDKVAHAFELEARRGLQGVLLQNAAIVNRTTAPVTIEAMEVAVQAAGDTVASRRLAGVDLDRAAGRAGQLAKAGLLEAYAFHFRPDVLLRDAKPSAERRLAPGTALLVGHIYVAFGGSADTMRVRVTAQGADGKSLEAEGALPLRTKPASKVEYHFPLAGTWFVGAGASLHDHHRWVVPEEFALDMARIGEGMKSHRGNGATRTDYLAYGEPVRAAADGVVRAIANDVSETDEPLRRPDESPEAYLERVGALQAALLAQGTKGITGNYVAIEHDGSEFSLYAHLKAGSVTVQAGQAVKRGQTLGALGMSGNVTEPHLHFHVTDGPDPLMSAGVPVTFHNLEIPWATGPRAPQSGDVVVAR